MEPLPHDYYYFLLNKGLGPEDDSPALQKAYANSRRKGRFEEIYRRKRRAQLGPGRFWAFTTGGVYLNKRRRQLNGEIPLTTRF